VKTSPFIMKNGDHSEYCKCEQCSGNAPRGEIRCAATIPGGSQCVKPMYHLGKCAFEPAMPFSTHLPANAV
jgi:hypothetical protein